MFGQFPSQLGVINYLVISPCLDGSSQLSGRDVAFHSRLRLNCLELSRRGDHKELAMSTMTTSSMADGRFRLGREITREDAARGANEPGHRPKLNLRNDKASVFIAEDLDNGETVAVKILNRGSSKVAEFRSRFQRDADIMRSFDHPNVVKTIASGITSEGQPYLVMEYLQGQTLADRIAEKGPIAPQELSLYLQQVASALDAAHARGIVHRDIHPNALMIEAGTGESATAKLLGFSLAKNLSTPSSAEAELTGKQTILGKAAYLSPEQARGGDFDGRADVYALGVTLYESLIGRLPFQGETDFQILLAQINGEVPPFPRKWSNHPGAHAIEAVVLKALSKKPADRPATAGILANLFEQALSSRRKRKIGQPWMVLGAGGLLVASAIILGKWLL
jgi:serine/threonine protein kinase